MEPSMLVVRAIEDHEFEAFREALLTTFGSDADSDPDGPARTRATVPPGRAWAAFDGATVVATAATFAMTLGVPGGTMPMAGLTMVAVRPSHRRRGLMRTLVGRHLDDARAHGEAISGLWATQAGIYGRFGYGIAAESDVLEIEWGGQVVAGQRALDAIAWVAPADARHRLPPIYERAVADRPGVLHRSPTWWDQRRFLEAPFVRDGGSLRRTAVAVRGGVDVGYVVYRAHAAWTGNQPTGKTAIDELIAVDGQAEATLWRFVAGIDLFPRAEWDNAPVDSALPWLLSDPRSLHRRRWDALWLRIDDVAAALAGRRYQRDGALRFAVDDEAWQLEVSGGQGTCSRTSAPAELHLDRAGLASLFLGGVSATTLARAGRAGGERDALRTADELLGWPVPPWCPEVF
jgi:predicted acetyltransferase